MKSRLLHISLFLVIASLPGCGVVERSSQPSGAAVPSSGAVSSRSSSAASPIGHAPYDPNAVQKTIEFYARRVRENPRGAIEYSLLAAAYLQKCRETGDIDNAARAEQAARHSLAIRTRNNYAAVDNLALSLLTQHRFEEAARLVKKPTAVTPDDLQAVYLRAECLIELGEYDNAKKILVSSGAKDDNAFANTLRARLQILEGKPQSACYLLQRAQTQADNNSDMPASNTAWFHMRRGDCLAGMGRAEEAEQAYHGALTLFPGDYRTLTALCRQSAGQGHWQKAIEWGQKAAAIVPADDTLALLYDAYIAIGNKTEAQNQLRILETIAHLSRLQGVIYDRQRALFYADHNRNLPEALALARKEMRLRHDIYAYDTLAWTCFKNNKTGEARAAADKAMRYGTQDALLFYHAGMIALAQGETVRGKSLLEQALHINPYFHPTAPSQIKSLLKINNTK